MRIEQGIDLLDRCARCARCGAPFRCGVDTGRCWCADLPPLPVLPAWRVADAPGCLCPDCLKALLAADALR